MKKNNKLTTLKVKTLQLLHKKSIYILMLLELKRFYKQNYKYN